VLILSLLAVSCGAALAQPLTLDEAVQRSLQTHEKIKQYEERYSQRRDENQATWGNFLPSVQFEASYNHLNEAMEIDLNPIRSAMIQLQASNQVEFTNIYGLLQGQTQLTPEQRAAVYSQAKAALEGKIPGFVETLKEQDYKTATLTGVQPIFMGGKLIAAKRFATSEQQAAEVELEKTRDEVTWETVNRYLAVLLLKEVVQTREGVLEGVKRHQSDAAHLFEQGLIPKAQLLRAEVAVAEAERNLFDDQNRLELAIVALRQSLDDKDNSPLIFRDSLVFHGCDDSLVGGILQAKSRQPLLRMLTFKEKGAAQKYVSERAEFLPKVAAFGKYEMYPEYLSSLEPRWIVGVKLQIPIFEGGRRYYRMRSARHLRTEVHYLQQNADKSVRLWVEQSYRSVRNAEERYRRLNPSVNLAKENLRQNEKRFQTGLGTSLEVIDSQLALEKSEIEQLTSLYDYYKSLNDLSLATGEPSKVVAVFQSKER
jgi:outer membrane protein TolC